MGINKYEAHQNSTSVLTNEETIELKNMEEDFKKYLKMDSDQFNNHTLWKNNFEDRWGNRDDFYIRFYFLQNKQKGISNLPSELKGSILKSVSIIIENDNATFENVTALLKKYKVCRKWNSLFLINKKTGEHNVDNQEERLKNLKIARIIQKIFNKTIKVIETDNSLRKGSQNPYHIKTFKIVPA